MALSMTLAALAATTATAMYLDAKHLLRHDLTTGTLAAASTAAQKYVADRFATNRMMVYHNIEAWARDPQTADRLFLIFEERSWTYAQFFACLNRVGNWLVSELAVQRGELVALDGGNSPEFLMVQFALEGIAAVPAFVNCNLTGDPLVHCVNVAKARVMLADKDVRGLIDPVQDRLKEAGTGVVWYSRAVFEALESKGFDADRLCPERRIGVRPEETSSLIYTSGTTGLPKGTIMIRGRALNTGRGVALYLGLKPDDRMYTCLPLYHGAAHGLCVTPSIHAGSTVVLSRKFSHKTFWPEVRKSNANILQYVGELCRYLVNAPPSPDDRNHNVKMAWGNGMRPDVWDEFRNRFGIQYINELYAATDGLGSSFNKNGGEFGKYAIGKRGLLWRLMKSKTEKRVRIDIDTEEIVRDENGFAIECELGEPGEVVHMLDPATEVAAFAGYYGNQAAGEKRKIRNLFRKGDKWFRSGDMMRQDADGCVYFVDRLGDTFRWKSENVSTNEVADVMGRFDQIAETSVLGVQVPHSDGRCGLAAVVIVDGLSEETFDFEGLAKHATAILPRYAVPIFVRVVKQLDYTGTYKLQKGRLKAQGVDLDKHAADDEKDSLYWLPPGESRYVPFRRKDWDELKAGRVRL